MSKKLNPTSRYRIVEETSEGRRYCFFCEVSGTAVYTTHIIKTEKPEEEIRLAWKEARPYFNGCSECGRWIRDEAYNVNEMKCIRCAPKRRETLYSK